MTTPSPVFAPLPHNAANNARYAELREASSVHRAALPNGFPIWLVTRYGDVKAGLRDERLTVDPRRLSSPEHKFGGRRAPEDVTSSAGRHMLNTDGAEHRRLRAIANAELSSGGVARWRPEIERVVRDQLDHLDEFARQAGDEPVNLMTAFANEVPTTVTGRVVGIDAADMPATARLIRQLASARDTAEPEMIDCYYDLIDRVLTAVERRRREPGNDLISQLLAKPGRIGARDLLSTTVSALVGGPTSTATALGYGAIVLSERPDLVTRLVTEDGAATGIVGELLRHHPPFPFAIWRFATEDVELGGTVIPKDATVLLSLAAANRDPRAFADADEIRPHRAGEPTHLSFGSGAHRCLGAPLTLLELELALPALFRRFPRLALAVPADEIAWSTTLFDRRMESLPGWPHGRPR